MKKILIISIVLFSLAQSNAQNFDVQQLSKSRKLDWSGSIGASTMLYNTTANVNRSNTLNYNVYGSFSGKVLDIIELPFSFSLNKYESNFTKPIMQFGISPRYKWVTLHVGNRNLTFNNYTLNGHTFLGAGIELNPGKFRFAAMYGRLRPSIEIDTASQALVQPAFKRIGVGFKIGFGSEKTFVDLIYFKAKDDSNSVSNWKNKDVIQKLGDAYSIKPAENTAIGITSKLTLFKSLSFNTEAGISLFNTDLTDTLGQYLIKQNIPLDININGSTSIKWAAKSGFMLSLKNFVLKAEYERVMPGYTTMGSYFFNNDLENITISPSGVVAKGKLLYNLSLGIQKNNLDNTKKETSKRLIANANIGFNPSAIWGFDINYNNFGMQTISGTLPINDTFRIKQVNQTFTFTPRFNSIHSKATHSFGIAICFNDINDRNVLTKLYGNMKATVFNLNHSTTFTKLGNSINSGINLNKITTTLLTNEQLGFTLGYTQAFFKQTLQSSFNINYNISKVNNEADGNIVNASAALSYSIKKHSFSFNYNLIKTTSNIYQGYTETIATLGYNIRIK